MGCGREGGGMRPPPLVERTELPVKVYYVRYVPQVLGLEEGEVSLQSNIVRTVYVSIK